MTEGQVHSARLNPAKIVDRQEVYVPNYFLDWAFEEVQRLMKGKGEFVLTARTTVDVPLQKLAEQAIETTFEREGRSARASRGHIRLSAAVFVRSRAIALTRGAPEPRRTRCYPPDDPRNLKSCRRRSPGQPHASASPSVIRSNYLMHWRCTHWLPF